MKLREITREIISLLEEKSGYLVQTLEDPKLPTLATIRMAHGAVPAHVVIYRPSTGESPDYAICWQCVFAMRLFECPPEQRFQIASSETGDQRVDALLNAPDGLARKYRLNQAQLEPLKLQLLGGLITHLRSVPIGLRVVSWLGRNYPPLRDLERQFAEKELAMAADSLAPSIRKMMPAEIFKPTHSINAAHAIFWAERLEKPDLVNPYRSMGFEAHGQRLARILSEIPDMANHDDDLVDRWADYLNIRSWYTWVPYTAP